MEEASTQDLRLRTKQFALRVIKVVNAIPSTVTGRAISGQLVRSGTAVAANYRASCKARSRAEFIAKMGAVEEEADESCFWLEMVVDAELLPANRVAALLREANELVAIMAASRLTAKRRS